MKTEQQQLLQELSKTLQFVKGTVRSQSTYLNTKGDSPVSAQTPLI